VIESKVSHEIGCWFASVGKIVLGRGIVLHFLEHQGYIVVCLNWMFY